MADEKKKRTWLPQYNKYLDELTPEEWDEMSNATCGTACDAVVVDDDGKLNKDFKKD